MISSEKHKGASIVALLTGLVVLLMLHLMNLSVLLITLQTVQIVQVTTIMANFWVISLPHEIIPCKLSNAFLKVAVTRMHSSRMRTARALTVSGEGLVHPTQNFGEKEI